ncbi:hypothetical protein KP509_24G023100 [Ceratopteris richardii]|nr:hypothetical protein KP509_24G023100 [Ceratopteris richardii]
MSKIELERIITATIGKKNVSLHNQLVKAILSNAVKGSSPPPSFPSTFEKAGSKFQSASVTSSRPHLSMSNLSSGDSFLSSQRSVRSTAFHNRDRDSRVSPLWHSEVQSSPNLSQSIQEPEGASRQLDAESNTSFKCPSNQANFECPASDDSVSVIESEVLREETFLSKEREELSLFGPIRGQIVFPFDFNSKNNYRRPALHPFSAHVLRQGEIEKGSLNSCVLPDSDIMHSLIQQTALHEGLEGAGRECAVVLNAALHIYLKRLIESCVNEPAGKVNMQISQEHWPLNSRNSVKLCDYDVKVFHNQSIGDIDKQGDSQFSISLNDFKVAMDIHPQQLGNNWAVQLEKISSRIFEQ